MKYRITSVIPSFLFIFINKILDFFQHIFFI